MDDLDLVKGLRQTPYVYEVNHSLLHSDAADSHGPNIGLNGRNLTITFLSMNRATLSEKLLRSISEYIPFFEGQVLIIDNGSSDIELAKLRNCCASLDLSIKIIELGENFGVGGGRNKTLKHVDTEWIMFLDNDIYFISNFLERLQKDIAVLGCHFISLPLLNPDRKTIFARGGNIYVGYDENDIYIGAGSTTQQKKAQSFDEEGFLSTFLFGGACVVKKKTFLAIGGYDSAMFVGFEDTDISIRLFQEGLKVGTCGALALVHDHPKPESVDDIDYERTRFTRNILRNSAIHLENKYACRFWSNGVVFWLDEKHRSLELEPGEFQDNALAPDLTIQAKKEKPLIALIIDSDTWAFANIARQIKRHLSDQYDFRIISTEIIDNINQILMMTTDCDIVHFFWRESIRLIEAPYFSTYADALGFSPGEFRRKFVESRTITSAVYDHLFLSQPEITAREELFNSVLAGYTVSSVPLMNIYKEIPNYQPPTQMTEDGVDLGLFKPQNIERFNRSSNEPLVIGWAGNSMWAADSDDDPKGFHTILKPAIEQLRQEGLNIQTCFADRQDGFIAHHLMPDYYAKIHLYVCTSKAEGTPNPVLEAMACGIPVIAPNVGIVSEAFGQLQKTMIVDDRTVEVFKTKIRELYKRPQMLTELSSENLCSIKQWDWSVKVQNFAKFFDHFLQKQGNIENQLYDLNAHAG